MLENLGWAAFTVVVAMLFAEGVCRVVYSRKLDYQIEMSRYAATLKRTSEHLSIGHEHRPSSREHLMGVDVVINSHGFRGEEFPLEKPDDEIRVLLLGDSLTLGWGAASEDVFAAVLQRKLDKLFSDCDSAKTVRVINTGVGNYNTDQEVSFFEIRGRDFRPDIVVLNYFINDAEPTPRQKSPFILKYSYLAMSLWGRLDLFRRLYLSGDDFSNYYPALYAEEATGWQRTREALARLVKLSQQDGFTLILALLPELHAIGPEYGFQDIYDRVRAVADEVGFERVVDLSPRFAEEQPESLWVSMDDAHPNARAHAIIAQGLFEEIRRDAIPGVKLDG